MDPSHCDAEGMRIWMTDRGPGQEGTPGTQPVEANTMLGKMYLAVSPKALAATVTTGSVTTFSVSWDHVILFCDLLTSKASSLETNPQVVPRVGLLPSFKRWRRRKGLIHKRALRCLLLILGTRNKQKSSIINFISKKGGREERKQWVDEEKGGRKRRKRGVNREGVMRRGGEGGRKEARKQRTIEKVEKGGREGGREGMERRERKQANKQGNDGWMEGKEGRKRDGWMERGRERREGEGGREEEKKHGRKEEREGGREGWKEGKKEGNGSRKSQNDSSATTKHLGQPQARHTTQPLPLDQMKSKSSLGGLNSAAPACLSWGRKPQLETKPPTSTRNERDTCTTQPPHLRLQPVEGHQER
ncbi:Octapeptide-repeat protein T2, partial [Ophiophagus hannah]